MSDQRNMFLFIGLSVALLLLWSVIFPPPKPTPSEETAQEASASAQLPDQQANPSVGGAVAQSTTLPRQLVTEGKNRVTFDAPRLDGSISLVGARIDDVRLKDYHLTPKADGCKDPELLAKERRKRTFTPGGFDPETCEILLLNPLNTKNAYFAEFGWRAPAGTTVKTPSPETVWTLEQGRTLGFNAPITLRWDNGEGLIFRQRISIDDNYMFEVVQSVENNTSAPVALETYGRVARYGLPQLSNMWVLHEGFVGVLDETSQLNKYADVRKNPLITLSSVGGWLGITDKYWLAAVIPPPDAQIQGTYLYQAPPADTYQAAFQTPIVQIQPGAPVEVKSHLFAGAKEVSLLNAYAEALDIEKFHMAVDWGWFGFLTKPLFYLLDYIKGIVGNFGIAILIATVLVKLVFYPLANRSYDTMSKMKKLQPQLKEMQERYKDDRVQLQQQMMELYKKEKLNPLAGCLPIFLQIPVFFSLYKVLFVSIEMRHAPFFGWIQDLSAPDPTTFINLFGLLPFDPSLVPVVGAFLMIGVWPILMGVTMWVQTSLNPTPQDPTQKMIFTWMPVIFTLMLAGFPVGLVIYWTWNNALSVLQQYVIMKRNGTDVSLAKSVGLDKLGRVISSLTNKKSDEKP